MNCWGSINIRRQLGTRRSIILAMLFGFSSFVLLYLPLTLIHKDARIVDHGLLPLLIGLALLPLVHKFLHVIPFKCGNKNMKLSWSIVIKCIPYFKICANTKVSKPTVLIALLLPTLLITIPCIVLSYVYPSYYPYLLLFSAINLSLSYSDFVYFRHIWKAPKKCIISNEEQGYDILIPR